MPGGGDPQGPACRVKTDNEGRTEMLPDSKTEDRPPGDWKQQTVYFRQKERDSGWKF